MRQPNKGMPRSDVPDAPFSMPRYQPIDHAEAGCSFPPSTGDHCLLRRIDTSHAYSGFGLITHRLLALLDHRVRKSMVQLTSTNPVSVSLRHQHIAGI